MTAFKRRGTGIISGILAFSAAVIVGISIGHDYWIKAELVRNVKVVSNNSTLNSVKGGERYFGLFHGCEAKTWGQYRTPRDRCFDVSKELSDVDYLYATFGLLCVAVFFLLIATILGIWNEFTTPYQWLFNSPGIYLANGLSFIFLFAAMCVFGGIYDTKFKTDVLNDKDKQDAFMTKSPTELGYCYWILLASAAITIVNIVLTVINKARVRHEFNTANKLPVTSNVDGMMLY